LKLFKKCLVLNQNVVDMKNIFRITLLFLIVLTVGCKTKKTVWKGQEPIKKVSTKTRPIQYQLKKTFDIGDGIFLSNEFDGARLNGVALTDKNKVTVLITPENTPINSSPWYAFKIWSEADKEIQLKVTYNEGTAHRYYPKLSRDGKNWKKLDSTLYLTDTASVSLGEKPKFCIANLNISPDTMWVAAQEIITSKDIEVWSKKLAAKSYVSTFNIGKSFEGRPIKAIQIGNPESKKLIMVLSRQHPPEISGWLAMKAFVEGLCEDDETTKVFRDEFCTFVVPCVNPDGVNHGHWRHGAGGIDLNRDWADFNQPETQTVRNFMHKQVEKEGLFLFAIDFHSTFQDIFYTINTELKGNMPGLIQNVINAVGNEIPGYNPNIRPGTLEALKISSSTSIFHEFGAEAVTYEVGDTTTRDFIALKARLTARKLMEELLK